MSFDAAPLRARIGRRETLTERIAAGPAERMTATLGLDRRFAEGDPLPPLWHWLHHLTAEPPERLGRDGHPRVPGFAGDAAPRRMWAGGRLRFHAPLRIGETADLAVETLSVAEKTGRSGPLLFVVEARTATVAGAPRIAEERDLVYRLGPGAPADPPAPPDGAEATATFAADPVTLFRYSALTFNGHRIHYDRDYARDVEGHPDLVVHGPLIATLLAGRAVAALPDRPLTRFAYRAVSPIHGPAPFALASKSAPGGRSLWAVASTGRLAMTAEAAFA